MGLLAGISILLHVVVLCRCTQFFVDDPSCRESDKHLVAAFGASSVFFFVISVANILYASKIEDHDMQGLLALWSGFVLFNATIQYAVVTSFIRRIDLRHRSVKRGVG